MWLLYRKTRDTRLQLCTNQACDQLRKFLGWSLHWIAVIRGWFLCFAPLHAYHQIHTHYCCSNSHSCCILYCRLHLHLHLYLESISLAEGSRWWGMINSLYEPCYRFEELQKKWKKKCRNLSLEENRYFVWSIFEKKLRFYDHMKWFICISSVQPAFKNSKISFFFFDWCKPLEALSEK